MDSWEGSIVAYWPVVLVAVWLLRMSDPSALEHLVEPDVHLWLLFSLFIPWVLLGWVLRRAWVAWTAKNRAR